MSYTAVGYTEPAQSGSSGSFCPTRLFIQVPGTHMVQEGDSFYPYDGDRKLPPPPAERTCTSECSEGYVPVIETDHGNGETRHLCLRPTLLQSVAVIGAKQNLEFRMMTQAEYDEFVSNNSQMSMSDTTPEWLMPAVIGVGGLALIGLIIAADRR